MKILSIGWGTCSTAALMVEGQIISCVSEERFSRIKNDDSYPLRAVEAVLTQGAVKPEELDLVVIAGYAFDAKAFLCHKHSRFSIQDRMREQEDYWYPRLYENKETSFLDIFKDKIDSNQYPGDWNKAIDFLKTGKEESSDVFFQEFRRQAVSRHLGIDPKKIIFVHHHLSHAYYAYYGSPIQPDKAIVLVAEAWGDDKNASVSIAEGGSIKPLSNSKDFIVGRLYRYITLLLGMKPDEHEYKVMGLAAYAKPKYYKEPLSVFQNTMYVNGLDFAFKHMPPDLFFYIKDKLKTFRFDSIAGAIQKYTQDILVEWTLNAVKSTGAKKVCLGGGVAMNVKAVMEIAKLKELDDVFVCPSSSDESTAIGAAYLAMHDICCSRGQDPTSYLKPLSSAYLGLETNHDDIEEVLKEARARGYNITKNPESHRIAQIIADGKIVARCAGRNEFGARALGNRSIIADPRNTDVIKVLNEKVKSRDFWMPFAPSILKEEADRYISNPKELKSPYMTIAFETKPPAWEDLRAAIHQYDLTARPQIVDKDTNPSYHDIISEFHKSTGVGGVLNTSFNVHGEPIVQTPQDAFDVFERTDLDVLVLDGYLIERKSKKQ